MKRVEKRQGNSGGRTSADEKLVGGACRGRAAFALSCCPRLEEEGFAVAEATNAKIALRVLENRRDVNLVFADIQLPGDLDGIGLAPTFTSDGRVSNWSSLRAKEAERC
jgi:hypothetical protein